MRFRDRIARFMYGRYGFGYGAGDKFNYFLLVLYLILGGRQRIYSVCAGIVCRFRAEYSDNSIYFLPDVF